MTTRTVWYVVPLFWGPITIYLFLRSLFQFTGPLPNFFVQPALPLHYLSSIPTDSIIKTSICFIVGTIIWTILEYTLHRFLFHIDNVLPDRPLFLMLHFLMHGIHHYLPMDRLRLVMPPVLFMTLQFPFTQLAYVLFPVAIANGIISGAFTFCKLFNIFSSIMVYLYSSDILYDCMHYA